MSRKASRVTCASERASETSNIIKLINIVTIFQTRFHVLVFLQLWLRPTKVQEAGPAECAGVGGHFGGGGGAPRRRPWEGSVEGSLRLCFGPRKPSFRFLKFLVPSVAGWPNCPLSSGYVCFVEGR